MIRASLKDFILLPHREDHGLVWMQPFFRDALHILLRDRLETPTPRLPKIGLLGEASGEFVIRKRARDLRLGREPLRKRVNESTLGGCELFIRDSGAIVIPFISSRMMLVA